MTRLLQRWGEWRHRLEDGTLEFDNKDPLFDLDSIRNASDALAEILEINRQPWATPRSMKDLLEALDYLLDSENDYCPKIG